MAKVVEDFNLVCGIFAFLARGDRASSSTVCGLWRRAFIRRHPPDEHALAQAIQHGSTFSVDAFLRGPAQLAGRPIKGRRAPLSCHLAHAVRHGQPHVARLLRGMGVSDGHVFVAVAAAEAGDVETLRRAARPPAEGVPRVLYDKCFNGVTYACLLSPCPEIIFPVAVECGFPVPPHLPMWALGRRDLRSFRVADAAVPLAVRDLVMEAYGATRWGNLEAVMTTVARVPFDVNFIHILACANNLDALKWTVRHYGMGAQSMSALIAAHESDAASFRFLFESVPVRSCQDMRLLMDGACMVGDEEAIRDLLTAGAVCTQYHASVVPTPAALRRVVAALGDEWDPSRTVNDALRDRRFEVVRAAWEASPFPLCRRNIEWHYLVFADIEVLDFVVAELVPDADFDLVLRLAVVWDCPDHACWAVEHGAQWSAHLSCRAARVSAKIFLWAVNRGLVAIDHFEGEHEDAPVHNAVVKTMMRMGFKFSLEKRTAAAWYAFETGDVELLRECGGDVRLTTPRRVFAARPHPAVAPLLWRAAHAELPPRQAPEPELGRMGCPLTADHVLMLLRDERLDDAAAVRMMTAMMAVPQWEGGTYEGWDTFYNRIFRRMCQLVSLISTTC